MEHAQAQTPVQNWQHMAMLFMALFASDPAASLFYAHTASRRPRLRRLAVYGRARAVVLFDRVINNQFDWMPGTQHP